MTKKKRKLRVRERIAYTYLDLGYKRECVQVQSVYNAET
jgi:hypothetical protein